MIEFENLNGSTLHESEPPPSIEMTTAPKRPLRPAERVRALAGLGPVVRLDTGIATLDRSCRGGIPTRRLVVVGGAPGTGKTTLATNWAWRWTKAGVPVAMLAVDEGPEGVLMRIAQLEGISAELIEERDPAALDELAALLDATPLVIVDGDDAMGTVEGAAQALAEVAGDRPAVLVVDSMQTVKANGVDEAKDAKGRVDCVVRSLKGVRDRYGFMTIATCELARGAYRSRSVAETINDLAAFKESGSVEYAAQTALVLRSVPDEASLVDVTVPKNRAYRRDAFRLRLDHITTAFEEVEMPPAPEGGRRSVDHLETDAGEIRKLFVSKPGINGARAVRQSLRARHVSMSNDRIGAAMEYLRDRGEVENRGSTRRPELYLVQSTPEGGESDE